MAIDLNCIRSARENMRLTEDVKVAINEMFMCRNLLEHNPGTGVFMEKMEDMIQIYNYTSKICFDDKKIYLLAG